MERKRGGFRWLPAVVGVGASVWLAGHCVDQRLVVDIDTIPTTIPDADRPANADADMVSAIWSEVDLSPPPVDWIGRWAGSARRALAGMAQRPPDAMLFEAGDGVRLRVVGSERDAVEERAERELSRYFPSLPSDPRDDQDRRYLLAAAARRLSSEGNQGANKALVGQFLGISSDLDRWKTELELYSAGRVSPMPFELEAAGAETYWPRLAGSTAGSPVARNSRSEEVEARLARAAWRMSAETVLSGGWPTRLSEIPHMASLESLPESMRPSSPPRIVRREWTRRVTTAPGPWSVAGLPLLIGLAWSTHRSRRTTQRNRRSPSAWQEAGFDQIPMSPEEFWSRVPERRDRRGRIVAVLGPVASPEAVDSLSRRLHAASGKSIRIALDAGGETYPIEDKTLAGLMDVVRGDKTLEDVIQGGGNESWRIAAGSPGHDDDIKVTASHILDVLTAVFDPVIVDCTEPGTALDRLEWCDTTVIVVPMSNPPTSAWRTLANRLANAGIPMTRPVVRVESSPASPSIETSVSQGRPSTSEWNVDRILG